MERKEPVWTMIVVNNFCYHSFKITEFTIDQLALIRWLAVHAKINWTDLTDFGVRRGAADWRLLAINNWQTQALLGDEC